MQKTLLTSLIIASISLGCSSNHAPKDEIEQANNSTTEVKIVVDPKLLQWVGQYSGILPCVPCFSRCEGCEGMGVDLTIHSDQTFKLVRTSYSGHNEAQIFEGQFEFLDEDKLEIQLVGVTERNQLFLGDGFTEVIDTKTNQTYEYYQDFQLEKII